MKSLIPRGSKGPKYVPESDPRQRINIAKRNLALTGITTVFSAAMHYIQVIGYRLEIFDYNSKLPWLNLETLNSACIYGSLIAGGGLFAAYGLDFLGETSDLAERARKKEYQENIIDTYAENTENKK